MNRWIPDDPQAQVISHFRAHELACKSGAQSFMSEILLERLHALREEWDRAMVIVSAYRSPAHNKAVGGAKRSYHMLGMAVDVSMRGIRARQRERFIALAEKHGFTGIGVYPTFTHIDVRKRRTRWRGS